MRARKVLQDHLVLRILQSFFESNLTTFCLFVYFRSSAKEAGVTKAEAKEKDLSSGAGSKATEQLLMEEAKQERFLLKLREKATVEKTLAELELLQMQKKILRDQGETAKAATIKKKQRGLLLRLHNQRQRIESLRKLRKKVGRLQDPWRCCQDPLFHAMINLLLLLLILLPFVIPRGLGYCTEGSPPQRHDQHVVGNWFQRIRTGQRVRRRIRRHVRLQSTGVHSWFVVRKNVLIRRWASVLERSFSSHRQMALAPPPISPSNISTLIEGFLFDWNPISYSISKIRFESN